MNHKNLTHVVTEVLQKEEKFKRVLENHATPFYVFDEDEVERSLKRFKKAFLTHIPDIKIYYALKTNHHRFMIKSVLKHGIGLDVSSPRELQIAKDLGCRDIVFTGPGKTQEGLMKALENSSDLSLLVDSFSELHKIGKLASSYRKKIKVGVRIYTKQQHTWAKFGIPLKDLKDFWKEAQKYPYVCMSGIQFHNSWNADAKPYFKTIQEVYAYIKDNFSRSELSQIKFVDIGGGFRPFKSEGYFTEQGDPSTYKLTKAIPIEEYAREIGSVLKVTLNTILDCVYFTEPGRILSNSSMHVVLRVVDKKSSHVVIMDGGTNIIGWERFEYEYFPVINITRPSLREHTCKIYGNLCMPQDIWGYSYFGERIEEGDVLVIPYQGTLTYSLSQEFIYPIPKVYTI